MKETISRYEVDQLTAAMVAARDLDPCLPRAADPRVNSKFRRIAEITLLSRAVTRELDRRGFSYVSVGRYGHEIVWWPAVGHTAVINAEAAGMIVDDLPVDVSGMSVADAVSAADAVIANATEVLA